MKTIQLKDIPEIHFPHCIDKESVLDNHKINAICQDGCASGAYMPAVTYHTARETMAEHGDDVLQYLQDQLGELPQPKSDESWSGISCFYLSCGVELWASSVQAQIEELEGEE